ncbi:MAG: hypothetical protein Q9213_001418 [Squamulea squamosa]
MSSPEHSSLKQSPKKQYKFSQGSNENDAVELRQALANIQIGQPQTHGGVFLESTDPKVVYDQFVTRTPPDVTNNTRIVAICGIDQKEASPQEDGWFLSDFFAFYHLLHGLTKHQSWLHCLDLKSLIDQHEVYLHGSPFKTRKVVLDAEMLSSAATTDLVKCAVGSMKSKFEHKLRDECQAAAQAGDSVLVLMFAHGSSSTGGVKLGSNFWKQDTFTKKVKDFNVPITILSTACFSGGWSCNKQYDKSQSRHLNHIGKQFNHTTMMAAGPHKRSRSWAYTTTIGRACGSMWSSAIVNTLTRTRPGPDSKTLIDDDDDDDDTERTDKQYDSYDQFTRVIYEVLHRDIDRRAWQHDITFSAEDDAWSICWMDRTGIPLAKYKARWDALEDHEGDPYLHPGDPQNRDPYVTSEQEAEYEQLKVADNGRNVYRGRSAGGYATVSESPTTGGLINNASTLGKRKASDPYGGNTQALINKVSILGEQYLASYQGFDNTGNDGALHNRINMIQQGKVRDETILYRCLRALDYRMNQMSMADDYLAILKVGLPEGKKCHEYQTKNLPDIMPRGEYRSRIDLVFERSVLFPMPVDEQGHEFYKGAEYLVAAFYHANIDKSVMVEKLDALAMSISQDLEYHKNIVKEIPVVKSKRQKLFQDFGINLGSISPTKRLSHGPPLAGRG